MNRTPDSNLRRFVDGELDPAESEAIERALAAGDTELSARVAHERHLRRAVGRVLGESAPTAPRALRDAITARLQEAGPATGPADPGGSSPEIETAPDTTRRSFWEGPRRANIFAVAASLALVAGAVLFGIFGNPIGTVPPGGPNDVAETDLADIANFVVLAHHDAVHELFDHPDQSLGDSVPEAEVRLGGLTGVLRAPGPTLAELDVLGYVYQGAVVRRVRGRGVDALGQVIYRHDGRAEDGCSASFVGCCVLPDTTGEFAEILPPVTSDDWRELEGASGDRISCATDGRFAYFVVCCNERDIEPATRLIAAEARRRDRTP